MDLDDRNGEKNPGVREQVPKKAATNILPGPNNKRSSSFGSSCSGGPTKTAFGHGTTPQAGMVWPYDQARQSVKDHHAGYSEGKSTVR